MIQLKKKKKKKKIFLKNQETTRQGEKLNYLACGIVLMENVVVDLLSKLNDSKCLPSVLDILRSIETGRKD